MDSSILTLIGSVAITLLTSVTTLGVANINSRKTRSEVHDEVETMRGQLDQCEARDVARRRDVIALTQRVFDLERQAINLRTGPASDGSPLEPQPERPR